MPFDTKEMATTLAKVLKYNPELLTEDSRFDDLVLCLEVRLMDAFFAGQEKAAKSLKQRQEKAIPVKPPELPVPPKKYLN